MNQLLMSLCKAGNSGITLEEVKLWVATDTISDQAVHQAFNRGYVYFSNVQSVQKVFLSTEGFNYLKQFNPRLIYGTKAFDMDQEMTKFIQKMAKKHGNLPA